MPTIADMLKQPEHSYGYIFTFGKYKDCALEDVLKDDPGYIVWASDNVDSFNPTDEIIDEAYSLDQDRKYEKEQYRPLKF